jgi:predicted RNA-binding Zn-ribbon protein involved in translation (DUF1610 family)
MHPPLACPRVESWQALLDETLPPEEQERHEHHLEGCPACQERLHHAGACAELLRRVAREIGDPTLSPPDPTLAQVLERLNERRGQDDMRPLGAADLYFLRPSDRPGLLGTLGNYEVQEVIGQGGMGVVLKAFDPALHRAVAIKVLAPHLAASPAARRRFAREAQAAAAVCHDHVVTVHGVAEVEGLPYLVMQYVVGESLQDRLNRAGRLDIAEVVRIGYEAASGLAAAHTRGLIHRDVKPANLLLEGGAARVRITDFGLARAVDDVGLTQQGVVAGTPEYMAPEQARAEPIDHRADLFSLGSVLYACCTGDPPFRGETALAVLRRVSDEPAESVRRRNPEVPDWLEDLIGRLLAKDPAQRYQSAAAVAALLGDHLAHLREPATVTAPAPRASGTGRRWDRGPVWVVAVLVALSTLGLFRLLLGAGGPPPQNPAPGEFYLDFRRGELPPEPQILWTGRDGDEVIVPEDRGLRITLPPNRKRPDPVGVVINVPVAGNFTITTGFELLRTDRPRTGAGVGYELYIMANTPGREAIALKRSKQPDDQDVFACSLMTTDEQGKRHYRSNPFPASAAAGRLRLSRSGSEVTCWAADGDTAELQELCRFDLGAEDLRYVRLCAHPGNSTDPLDIRIVDVRVSTNVPLPASDLAPAAAPAGGMRKGIALALALGLVGVFALAVLAVWHLRQRRRAGAVAAPATPRAEEVARPEVAAFLSFACPECGKKLKVRAEQAGKRGKCPHCGKAVPVPGDSTYRAERPPV